MGVGNLCGAIALWVQITFILYFNEFFWKSFIKNWTGYVCVLETAVSTIWPQQVYLVLW